MNMDISSVRGGTLLCRYEGQALNKTVCRKVREKFVKLAERWHDETGHLSSPSRISDNDTYLKIVSMGEPVIPLILQDLQERGGNWYRALRILSGSDPVSSEVRGEVPRMKEAWLRWGCEKGYIQ